MSDAIIFNNIDIVFGDQASKALPLLDQGRSRSEISGVCKATVGVANASLSVREGEILVLMGLSGSGKSTLLRAVNGLAPVLRGDIAVRSGNSYIHPYETTAARLRDMRRNAVSMVFQQFALLPWLTVAENVGFGLSLAGVPAREIRARVDEQLALVKLADRAGSKVSELSGGMQQRVGLARALATQAPILLMDEPFSALDPLIRTRLQDELLELQQTLKKTILFVSHDLDEAFRIGNRVAIMHEGRIVQCGTPRQIVGNPADDHVADFVRHMNPLSMLTAGDIMQPGVGGAAARLAVSATAKPGTPLPDILDALARSPGGAIGIVDNGAILGTISTDDVIKGLSHHRLRRT